MNIEQILANAKAAKAVAATYSESERNTFLLAMANALQNAKESILKANAIDLKNAEAKISDTMLDRLRLTCERIEDMAQGLRDVVKLASPLDITDSEYTSDNGLLIKKVRVPMGVIAMIYESRPNVTSDTAALCIKSGNVCILRGGSDAINSNKAIVFFLRNALINEGANADMVQLVEDTSHESVNKLMRARGYVDLLIPRGGKSLIEACVKGARGVPVIETGTGICHVYIDKSASLDMATNILYNAKTSRPSVCNSAEVCLVHQDISKDFLPKIAELLKKKNVELRLDAAAAEIISGLPAEKNDFDTEFSDYVLAIAVVDSLASAIEHINQHSTGHSDSIVTEDSATAQTFLNAVDSAAVYWNASTRFTDGGVFGFGCEIGISTQKLGARGPMGLYELTSYKYQITGKGQIR